MKRIFIILVAIIISVQTTIVTIASNISHFDDKQNGIKSTNVGELLNNCSIITCLASSNSSAELTSEKRKFVINTIISATIQGTLVGLAVAGIGLLLFAPSKRKKRSKISSNGEVKNEESYSDIINEIMYGIDMCYQFYKENGDYPGGFCSPVIHINYTPETGYSHYIRVSAFLHTEDVYGDCGLSWLKDNLPNRCSMIQDFVMEHPPEYIPNWQDNFEYYLETHNSFKGDIPSLVFLLQRKIKEKYPNTKVGDNNARGHKLWIQVDFEGR